MLSIYTRRDGSNRRSILMINGAIVKVEPDQYDVRVEARDRDSELTYVLHFSHEAIAGLYGHSQRVQRPLPELERQAEPAGTLEAPLEVERQAEPAGIQSGDPSYDSRAELALETDSLACPEQAWAKYETAQRKARDWSEASGGKYVVKFFPGARDGRGGYVPVLLS